MSLAFNLIRRTALQLLDVARDPHCVIDSLPIPVMQFYLVPSSTGDWRAHQATFGMVPSKGETIFGYKLHLLITVGGVILDFELAPANATDLEVGFELLGEHTDLEVLASARSLKRSMVNSPSSSTLRKTMPTPFGGCAPVCTPS